MYNTKNRKDWDWQKRKNRTPYHGKKSRSRCDFATLARKSQSRRPRLSARSHPTLISCMKWIDGYVLPRECDTEVVTNSSGVFRHSVYALRTHTHACDWSAAQYALVQTNKVKNSQSLECTARSDLIRKRVTNRDNREPKNLDFQNGLRWL